MKRLTEEQQRVLALMQKRPNDIHTGESLNCLIGTLDGLKLRGLASGVFGETRTKGRQRGAWWRLTQAGKDFELLSGQKGKGTA